MIKIYTDGGSRGNPGKSAGAFIVVKSNEITYEQTKFLKIATNNESEYNAIISALIWIKDSEFRNEQINLFSDSELVIKQINGDYKIKKEHLQILNKKVIELIKENDIKISFSNLRREDKFISRADFLVNQELDKH